MLTSILICITVAYAVHVHAANARAASDPPAWFVPDGLCVHAGWHYTADRQGRPPDYWLWGRGYWRTTDVPDSESGGSGEGAWDATSNPSYGGGLSFTVGTWNRAAGLSHGAVPYAGSTWAIATQPPRVQLLAMWLIVRQDKGSFGEWPQTSVACGI